MVFGCHACALGLSHRMIIQSNVSGPENSGHKFKRKEWQRRGEAQMEEARASTSSQRPEPFPTGNNRDIPVAVQELVYGSKESGVRTSGKYLDRHNELISSFEKFHEPRKDRAGPRKGQQACRSSSSLQKQESSLKSAKQGQVSPKEKAEGKGKIQVEQALPTELQNYKERKERHGQCAQYGKNSDGILKQEGGKNEPTISKEIDFIKLLTNFETCNNQILAEPNNFHYIQQKLERIESNVTLLNQPDDNSISFMTKKLKDSRIQVQNLEYSTGHNAALFQEQLEKSDKARLELKKDIKSSIHHISLKNELLRKTTPIPDRNVFNLNNDLHHMISSNAEVEATCNFKNIPGLEEWPTFSGEGEYNHMEFMKTIDMFDKDLNITDEYISARLHSLFTK
ncbi:hypothetical protein O181_041266 [Austropuccinia psidii MF-1]|uniref:Uncharacterized protein n=1 Tax=Austropuccinia psidii MF-1 TaxID=1389203 RepID=A0A9Q3HE39_9BASI|nr:hypothetical protein [Austropuccinia psidii MF-1]